jgi:hypothetical protein
MRRECSSVKWKGKIKLWLRHLQEKIKGSADRFRLIKVRSSCILLPHPFRNLIRRPSMKAVRTTLVLLLSLVLIPVGTVLGQKNKPGTGAPAAKPSGIPKKPSITPSAQEDKVPSVGVLRAKISTSRPEVAFDGSYGIFADLENIGSVPVTIYTAETVLAVQPEVSQTNACVYRISSLFPTEIYSAMTPPTQGANPTPTPSLSPSPKPTQATAESNRPVENATPLVADSRGVPIRIQPSEHYTVFWDVNRSNSNSTSCAAKTHWYDPFSFVPGEYVFTVDGKAYLEGETKYHTYTEKTNLRVSIPQIWAIFAAMFGGLLAYSVTSLQPNNDIDKLKTAKAEDKRSARLAIVRGTLAAPLMGAAVTIVASRLADTQFPIKVSVNDVWGAMTIGFIAFFAGNKLIEKLVGTVKT